MENHEGNTKFIYDEPQFAVPDHHETEFENYETDFGEHETEFGEHETEFENYKTEYEKHELSPTERQATDVIADSDYIQSFLPISKAVWQRTVDDKKETKADVPIIFTGNNIPSPTDRFHKQSNTAKVPKWKLELAQKNRSAPKVPQWKIELSHAKKERSANVPLWKQELSKTRRSEKVDPWKKELSERHRFTPGDFSPKCAASGDKGSRFDQKIKEAVQRTAFFEEGNSINDLHKHPPTPTEETFGTPFAGSNPDQIFSSIPIGVALPPPSVCALNSSGSSEIPQMKLELAKREQSKKGASSPQSAKPDDEGTGFDQENSKAVQGSGNCDEGDSRNEMPRLQPTPTEITSITADEKIVTPSATGSSPDKIFSSITVGVALPPPSVCALKLSDSSEIPTWKLELAKRNQLKKGAFNPQPAVRDKETGLGGEHGTYNMPKLKPTPTEIKRTTHEEELGTTSEVNIPAPIKSCPKQNNTAMISKTKLEITERNRSPTKVPQWKNELAQRKRLKMTKMAPAWKIELSQRNKMKASVSSSVASDKADSRYGQDRLRPTNIHPVRKIADCDEEKVCSEFDQVKLRPTKRQPEQKTTNYEERNGTHDLPMLQPSPKDCFVFGQVRLRPTNGQHVQKTAEYKEGNNTHGIRMLQPSPKKCSEICQVRLRPTYRQHVHKIADCEEGNGAHEIPMLEPIPEECSGFGQARLRPTNTNAVQKTADCEEGNNIPMFQPSPRECSEICKVGLRPTNRQLVRKTAECEEGNGAHDTVILLPDQYDIKSKRTEKDIGTVSKSSGQMSRVSPTKDGKPVFVPPAPSLPKKGNTAFYHWNLELTQYKLQLAQMRKANKGVHNRPSIDDARTSFDEDAIARARMDLQQYKISSDVVPDQCSENKVKEIQPSISSEFKDQLSQLMAELKTNLPKPASAFDDTSDTQNKDLEDETWEIDM